MQVHYNLLAGAGPRPVRDPAAARARHRRHHAARHHAAAGAGRDAVPREARRRPAVRPRGRDRRRHAPRSAAPATPTTLLLPAVRRQAQAQQHHVLRPGHLRADDDPRRRRPHAPARPLDQDRGQPRHARARRRSWTSRSGTSTTRAPSRSSPVHGRAGDTVRVTCRHVQWLRDKLPSFEGSPRSTSCGARAPPTRCASGS